jgi:hypothetical protein
MPTHSSTALSEAASPLPDVVRQSVHGAIIGAVATLAGLALVAGCTRTVRQTPSARVPPAPRTSTESRAANTSPDSTREYSGELESGFETSVFRGCNGSTPAKVWVTFAPDATVGAHWSDNTGGAATTRRYYVRMRGILRGPAPHRGAASGYGHLGGFDYELYVIRVLEVKPPGEPNCAIKR